MSEPTPIDKYDEHLTEEEFREQHKRVFGPAAPQKVQGTAGIMESKLAATTA
jgi:hypothetical protein